MNGPLEAEWTLESKRMTLRLSLHRIGDRFQQRIEATNRAGEVFWRSESVEGTNPVGWVVDPPSYGSRPDVAAGGSTTHPTESFGLNRPTLDRVRSTIDESWPPSPPFQQFHEQEIDGRRTWFLVGMAGKSHWSASVVALADATGWEFDVACRYREPPRFLGSGYRSEKTDVPPPGSMCATIGCSSPATLIGGMDLGFAAHLGPHAAPPASARWSYTLACSRGGEYDDLDD